MSERITDPSRLAELREMNNYTGQPDRCDQCGSSKRAPGLCCIVCGAPNPIPESALGKMQRMHVYVAIDGERDYQDQKHGSHRHTIPEWIVIMKSYLAKAEVHFAKGSPNCENFMLDELRKVVASGVCCMEQNGIVGRRQELPKCDVCGDTAEEHCTQQGYDHEFGGIDPGLIHDQHGDLKTAIKNAINRHSAENGSNTPDFILAEYLIGALELFDATTQDREKWYGREPKPVPPDLAPPPPIGFITTHPGGERCTNP